MDEIEGKPEQNVLQQLAVRSMAKPSTQQMLSGILVCVRSLHALYITNQKISGCDGASFLQHYLDGGKSVNKKNTKTNAFTHLNAEKRAADAERASIKYKQVEFMSMAEDKMFDGIITGVPTSGFLLRSRKPNAKAWFV